MILFAVLSIILWQIVKPGHVGVGMLPNFHEKVKNPKPSRKSW